VQYEKVGTFLKIWAAKIKDGNSSSVSHNIRNSEEIRSPVPKEAPVP
jgi:hypothetical protein